MQPLVDPDIPPPLCVLCALAVDILSAQAFVVPFGHSVTILLP